MSHAIRLALLCIGCGRVAFDPAAVPADAAPALALDPSFPVVANLDNTAVTAITTAPFSVDADRLVVALVVWGTGSTDQQPIDLTGGGLTWTRRAYSTFLPGPVPPGTSGDAIWTAYTTTPLTDIQVTATRGTTTELAALTLALYAFSGAATGNTATHSDQTTSTPLVASVDATAAGSWILGAFHHGTANAPRAATPETQWDVTNDPTASANGHFHAIGRLRDETTAPGLVTIGSATPGPYALTSAIEIRPR